MIEQIIAVLLQQARPAIFRGNLAWLVVWRHRPLVRHLEEQQIRQLFDVVAVAHPVVAKDVAVVPEFLNDLRGLAHPLNSLQLLRPLVTQPGPRQAYKVLQFCLQ